MSKVREIAILGSTGSIGANTLDVIDRLGPGYRVTALAAGSNLRALAAQIAKYRPRLVSVEKKGSADALRPAARKHGVRLAWGPEGAEEVAAGGSADTVVSAITGIDGFRPTLAAVRAGRRVALANKESMVVGGPFLRREAARSGSRIIPVDSEHSGVFQCLAKERKSRVRRVILTASGGPFFRTALRDIGAKSPAEVVRHPRWKMGRKVSVDSATLMNKGLELIEARWLFDLEPDRLAVLIHPQATVHSLVEMADGSVLAQLSVTDMRIPIQYALTWPDRRESDLPALDLGAVRSLQFFEVEGRRYPLFGLALEALRRGRSLPVALNAANETVVGAFLDGRIAFLDIPGIIFRVMEAHRESAVESIDGIFEIDREARRAAGRLLRQR